MNSQEIKKQWDNLRDSVMQGNANNELYVLSEKFLHNWANNRLIIHSMQVTDYRCFSKLSVVFDSKLTVFHGTNGRGKSSIVECIAKQMSWLIGDLCGKDGMGKVLEESDIRLANDEDEIGNADGAEITSRWKVGDAVIPVRLAKSVSGAMRLKRNEVQTLRSWGEMYRVFNSTKHVCRPLLYYLSAYRGASYAKNIKAADIEERAKRMIKDSYGITAYDDALTDNKDPRNFLAWLSINIKQKKFGNNDAIVNATRRLDAFFKVLKKFWNEAETVELDQSSGIDQLLIVVRGKRLSIKQLSDGQRLIFFLFGEIVWRLILLNPSLDDPLLGSGVVLIDEIELHLHPQWQLQIVDSLCQSFPNVQFIITTHSPQVLSCICKEYIRKLPENPRLTEVLKPSEIQTRGRSSNEILEMIMGTLTPAPEMEEGKWIERCRNAIADYRFEEGELWLAKIQQHFGNMSDEAVILERMMKVFKKRKEGQKNHEKCI